MVGKDCSVCVCMCITRPLGALTDFMKPCDTLYTQIYITYFGFSQFSESAYAVVDHLSVCGPS